MVCAAVTPLVSSTVVWVVSAPLSTLVHFDNPTCDNCSQNRPIEHIIRVQLVPRRDFGTGSALVAGVKCNRPLAAAAGAEGAEGTEGTDTLTSLPSEGNEGKSKKRFSFTSRERSVCLAEPI
jgi:hypothetical protein